MTGRQIIDATRVLRKPVLHHKGLDYDGLSCLSGVKTDIQDEAFTSHDRELLYRSRLEVPTNHGLDYKCTPADY